MSLLNSFDSVSETGQGKGKSSISLGFFDAGSPQFLLSSPLLCVPQDNFIAVSLIFSCAGASRPSSPPLFSSRRVPGPATPRAAKKRVWKTQRGGAASSTLRWLHSIWLFTLSSSSLPPAAVFQKRRAGYPRLAWGLAGRRGGCRGRGKAGGRPGAGTLRVRRETRPRGCGERRASPATPALVGALPAASGLDPGRRRL